MFYLHPLLTRKGPLGTVWLAGHLKSKKLSKSTVMKANLLVICNDLEIHIKVFALPTRASLILGATILLQRKTAYLLQDVLDLKKKMQSSRLTGRAVPIDMKEIPAEKALAMVTLVEAARIQLGLNFDLDVVDFDLDEPLAEDHFNRNMAREEDITMPGFQTMLTEYKQKPRQDLPLDDPFGDFGLEEVPPMKGHSMDVSLLTGMGDVTADVTNVPADVTKKRPFPADDSEMDLPPQDVLRSAEDFTVAELPLVRNRRGGRRQKQKFDNVISISKEEMRAQIADRTVGLLPNGHPNADVFRQIVAWKNAEKLIYTTGDSGCSKIFQTQRYDAYKTALASFKHLAETEAEAEAEAEDPFGWCLEGDTFRLPADTNRLDPTLPEEDFPPQDALRLTMRDESLLVPGFDQMYVENQKNDGIESIAVEEEVEVFAPPGISLPDTTTSSKYSREKTSEPSAKKVRRELNEQERADRTCEAADFLNTRFDKFVSQGPVTFQRMIDGNSRKKAARCFAYLLRIIKDRKVTVKQEEPYGPIIVTKNNPRISL